MWETTHRSLRLALASLLLVALAAEFVIGMSRAELTIVNFFSFFTILSNTFAVVMLTMLAGRPQWTESTRFSQFRGAVTVYMSLTGLVFAVHLAPTDVGLTEPWVNWSLHVIGPLAIALDWIVFAPEARLPRSTVPIWAVFPAVYLAYTLIRGAIVDWYPYPFLDPGETAGYAEVAMWSPLVLVVVLGFGSVYYWWANRRQPATATA